MLQYKKMQLQKYNVMPLKKIIVSFVGGVFSFDMIRFGLENRAYL